MNYIKFKKSIKQEEPPDSLDGVELALWYAVKGDWDMAHNIAQEIHSEAASWIHAYLHRQEGDIGNAHYWYRRFCQCQFIGIADLLRSRVVSVVDLFTRVSHADCYVVNSVS